MTGLEEQLYDHLCYKFEGTKLNEFSEEEIKQSIITWFKDKRLEYNENINVEINGTKVFISSGDLP